MTNQNEKVILFPEGSRGEPEVMVPFKTGVSHLAKANPEIPVIPIFLHGLGKALPKGEAILVPFFCDVFLGESIHWNGQKETFMDQLANNLQKLSHECNPQPWN